MIKIICVGKLKEKYLSDACQEYLKRITKYTKIEIIELKDSNILEERDNILKYINNHETQFWCGTMYFTSRGISRSFPGSVEF